MQAMFKTVWLQVCATLLVVLGAGLTAGALAAGSAALGGVAYVLPNFLFALRLSAESHRASGARPIVFLIGEFIKLAATVAILAVIAFGWPQVHWLCLILGLVAALKANLFAFLIRT